MRLGGHGLPYQLTSDMQLGGHDLPYRLTSDVRLGGHGLPYQLGPQTCGSAGTACPIVWEHE